MERHDNLVLMGQDIAEYGGVFKITEGFVERFGKSRVRNTPICESAIVGAGLGLRYAYVHLALADTPAGLGVVAEIARSLALPQRSWVLPFDSDLAGEWQEIWPDAPAPPFTPGL
jgi:hypothetical protein